MNNTTAQTTSATSGQHSRETADLRYMQAAIRFARSHVGITGTNPSVACLIVAGGNGRQWIAGRGVTAIGGRPHAEPVALAEAGDDAKGATAYVTLEPCAHHGVTLPCASTLIDAGIARVVSAQRDPDSRVNSKGFQMLRDAGIEVVENVATIDASWGIRGYLSRKSRKRPWVLLKLAATSDGYMGLRGAGQVAITGPVANAQTHLMRARADAILIGSGTAIADDPALTCRLQGLRERSPVRIVLENTNRMPRDSKFIKLASEIETFIACPQEVLHLRRSELAGTSCKFIACDTSPDNANPVETGEIVTALPELLADLADIGISSLMVEGGQKIAKVMLENELIDELILYIGREKMADKPAAKSNASRICCPVSPDAIPDGFHISAQWQYGTDKTIRMIRD